MKDKAFKLGYAFAMGMRQAKRGMAQDSWVTLQNKEGENYRVDLPGENPNSTKSQKSPVTAVGSMAKIKTKEDFLNKGRYWERGSIKRQYFSDRDLRHAIGLEAKTDKYGGIVGTATLNGKEITPQEAHKLIGELNRSYVENGELHTNSEKLKDWYNRLKGDNPGRSKQQEAVEKGRAERHKDHPKLESDKQRYLRYPLEVKKETEKAVAVENPLFREWMEARSAYRRGDYNEIGTKQQALLHERGLRKKFKFKYDENKEDYEYVWIPKSRSTIKDGYLYGTEPWLADKHEIAMDSAMAVINALLEM